MELWALRHPVSLWNELNIHQGQDRREPGLSTKGVKQAERIGEYLRNFDLISIWSSPLPRTIQLAEIINKYQNPKIPLFLEPALMEVTHGEADGLHISEVQKRFPDGISRWKNRNLDDPCFPGGEPLRNVAKRGSKAFSKIARTAAQSTIYALDDRIVIVISHGAILKLSLAQLSGLNLDAKDWWHKFPQDNGCINILQWTGKTLLVKTVNSTDHLGDTRYTPKITI